MGYRSRKFLLTCAVLSLTFMALFFNKITGGEAAILIPAVLTIYTGGNVTAKHRSFQEYHDHA